jgi:DNA-binding CsgD family transcriptional regulator
MENDSKNPWSGVTPLAPQESSTHRQTIMLSQNSFKTKYQKLPDGASGLVVAGDGVKKKKNHVVGATSNKARAEHAEARAEQAETRTEQAKTRTELAESRTERAEARTEQAETRTELAKTRTEQAEARTEQAETSLARVVHGDAALHQGISTRLEKGLPLDGIADGQSPIGLLTSRQREILMLIAEGQNTKQIAEIFKVSPKTVEYHRMKLMDCLNVHDVPGLVRLALRAGLVPSEG